MLRIVLVVLVSLATLAPSVVVVADPLQPLIKPGYRPADDARPDELGLWMQMDEEERRLRTSPILFKEPALTAYVEDLVCTIAQDYCPDVRVYVVQNPMFNASMAPNGTMIIHSGLLIRATSSDQVAAVVGHELAHYTQTHSVKGLRAMKNRLTVGSIVSIGLAGAGVGASGLPELLALSSAMGFNRKQESEADLLGAQFMSAQGFAPQAAAQVWMLLEQEETNASIKREQGSMFLASHPAPERRAQNLAQLAAELESHAVAGGSDQPDPLLAVLQKNYARLMDEQVKLGDHGRLQTLLARHRAMGIAPSDVDFYLGESWRIRGGAGDHEKAMQAYAQSIGAAVPNARAFRELGYLEYKHGDKAQARNYFARFLELVPEASDRQMIEFYLEDGW